MAMRCYQTMGAGCKGWEGHDGPPQLVGECILRVFGLVVKRLFANK